MAATRKPRVPLQEQIRLLPLSFSAIINLSKTGGTMMAASAKDLQLRELKDTVSQLKMMIFEQTELIRCIPCPVSPLLRSR